MTLTTMTITCMILSILGVITLLVALTVIFIMKSMRLKEPSMLDEAAESEVELEIDDLIPDQRTVFASSSQTKQTHFWSGRCK